MSPFKFSILIFLGCILFIGYSECEDEDKSQCKFGKKVKELLSDEDYDKTFSVNPKNETELDEAIKNSTKNYYEILNITYNEENEKKLEKENSDVGLKNINGTILFHSQTCALERILKKLGKLDDDNIDDVAQAFVDKIHDAVADSKGDDIGSKFIVMTTAVAKFLISQDVTKEEDVKTAVKFFMEELKKYLKKKD